MKFSKKNRNHKKSNLFSVSKKVTFLITIVVSSLTFNSCSSSDDSPQQDQLIGKWKLFQVFEDAVQIILDDCDDLEGTLEFKSDGTLTSEDYRETTGGCVLNDTLNGTWVRNANNSYTFVFDGSTDTVEVIFENNTFSITILDGTVVIKTVYIKQ